MAIPSAAAVWYLFIYIFIFWRGRRKLSACSIDQACYKQALNGHNDLSGRPTAIMSVGGLCILCPSSVVFVFELLLPHAHRLCQGQQQASLGNGHRLQCGFVHCLPKMAFFYFSIPSQHTNYAHLFAVKMNNPRKAASSDFSRSP